MVGIEMEVLEHDADGIAPEAGQGVLVQGVETGVPPMVDPVAAGSHVPGRR